MSASEDLVTSAWSEARITASASAIASHVAIKRQDDDEDDPSGQAARHCQSIGSGPGTGSRPGGTRR